MSAPTSVLPPRTNNVPRRKLFCRLPFFALRAFFALVLTLAALPFTALRLAAQTSLSAASSAALEEYAREGLAHSESIVQRKYMSEKSFAALGEAQSMFLPNIAFAATYTRADGGRTVDFPVGDLLNPVYAALNQITQSEAYPRLDNANILLNPDNFYDARFRITAPLYNVDLQYNARIKSEQTTLQKAELAIAKRELVRDIKTAYYRYCQALQAVKIYESVLLVMQENERGRNAFFSRQRKR